MKKRLTGIGLAMILLLSIFYCFCLEKNKQLNDQDYLDLQYLEVNELIWLSKDTSTEGQVRYEEKQKEFKDQLEKQKEEKQTDTKYLTIMYVGFVILIILGLLFIYIEILRPFEKLKEFASEIASGDFTKPLDYERGNYFGAFTWAFDHMRREIIKARSCEKQAIENNKTVIATLSHDIKTPIASIRAYAEGLDAGLNKSIEKRHKYTAIIIKKCDEVTKLTNDLFLHSISDLDKLQITCETMDFATVFQEILAALQGNFNDLRLLGPLPDALVKVDGKRLEQVMENIIGNARKYAKGTIELKAVKKGEDLVITIRDFGNGILDKDLPFIFDKFYRGENVGTKEGAGLGLFIVKYIMEQMDGTVMLKNETPGLLVKLTLPIVIS
ncbi:MAG: HAMP domain-containing sensor histidine kinase [bacterium]|nr:HAMP domain-containing sensor histidine kinase [bacterium]